MKDQIDRTLEYYKTKEQQILNAVNSNKNLTIDDIIHFGEEASIINYKLTALEIAKEN
ncbi:hypothetical protein [Psychroserpens luteus]|uniref:Uncharacterized protein n=1 Tax=Psychroserpens luteus TaxID=1434066 RepID=A0ABW5ZV52_9FLAO|nr:hypothetical protein [Psychroserpens luteus]